MYILEVNCRNKYKFFRIEFIKIRVINCQKKSFSLSRVTLQQQRSRIAESRVTRENLQFAERVALSRLLLFGKKQTFIFRKMSIKPLNKETIKLINSTQVITSIYSAIKELVENSLDAQAENIEINLVNCYFEYIYFSSKQYFDLTFYNQSVIF